jgi:hypothetical protein
MAREVPVAAVWPSLAAEALVAPAPANDGEAPAAFEPTPAMADVPAGVARLVVGSYAALILVFYALFARSALAFFSITVCAFFVAMFFSIPKIFLAVEAAPGRPVPFDRFMREGMAILTGRSGGRDAIVQMVIVPVLLTLGLAAMGLIGRYYIP